jgi:flagellar assembly protein FliH
MSTSFSPALSPAREPERTPEKIFETIPFPYAAAGEARGKGGQPGGDAAENVQREQAARQQGQREGEERARALFEEQLTKLRGMIGATIQDFARQRESYYEQVEAEVVQLALSIAHKILHRESQVDPLLLAALVRVALDKIEDRTKIKVRSHPQNVTEWRAYFAKNIDPQRQPELIEDDTMDRGRCVLDTALGATEMGVEVQLKEIERGLMDLLGKRPPVVP